MDGQQILFWILRVTHVGTAIVLVGGAFFLRFVLIPAATETLPSDEHDKLRARLMGTWKRIVHGGIALLLLSGAANWYRVIASRIHSKDGLYHALLGTKFLLALAVFFIASALVGRSAAFEGMRKNAKKWLAVNLTLALIIVLISGFLRLRKESTSQPVIEAAAVAGNGARTQ